MEAVLSSGLIPVLKTHNRKSSPAIFSVKSMPTTGQKSGRGRERAIPMSPSQARLSLVAALASQTAALSKRLLMDLASETAKYVFPSKRFETRNLEEALMSVPDLETVEFKVLNRNDQYEIREVESFFIAETTMPGKFGFDLSGASQSFNVLAEYLFGKNTNAKQMEMTTPVFTRRVKSEGTKLELTTPVMTKRPGFVTDEEVERRESTLRDSHFSVKEGVSVKVAQYNPPFTLPFARRNETAAFLILTETMACST